MQGTLVILQHDHVKLYNITVCGVSMMDAMEALRHMWYRSVIVLRYCGVAVFAI